MGTGDHPALRFDADRLTTALRQIPEGAWSQPSAFSYTQVHHGYRRIGLVSASQWQPHAELFEFVWDALNPVRDAWLSWIEPGGFILPHRDAGPWWERWQVPIQVAGDWRTDNGTSLAVPGSPFQVTHWEPHAVTNRGTSPRIHLVVDRNVQVDQPPLPFATYPPADMADLIERATQ